MSIFFVGLYICLRFQWEYVCINKRIKKKQICELLWIKLFSYFLMHRQCHLWHNKSHYYITSLSLAIQKKIKKIVHFPTYLHYNIIVIIVIMYCNLLLLLMQFFVVMKKYLVWKNWYKFVILIKKCTGCNESYWDIKKLKRSIQLIR